MIIAARFNGPPGSGNGGYSAGLVGVRFAAADRDAGTAAGRAVGGVGGVEVTLRRPPPLDTEMTVREERATLASDADRTVAVLRVYARVDDYTRANDYARAHDDERVDDQDALVADALVAEALATTVHDDEVVPGVPFAEAVEASASYPGFVSHPFPTCFVCGPLRPAGDGLRLFPGRLGDGRTAAPFVIPATISDVLVWAALDCPGGWAVPLEDRPYVLGRIAARVGALPAAGDECVVMGAMVGEQGRRAFVRTTLYSPAGNVLARARATWVAVERPSGAS